MCRMQIQPQDGVFKSQGQGPMGQAASTGPGGVQVEASLIGSTDAIRAEHIITCGELELYDPIAEGIGGKVGMGAAWAGTLSQYYDSASRD
jgi:hypothetical protein